jgi:hypothetical protein
MAASLHEKESRKKKSKSSLPLIASRQLAASDPIRDPKEVK